MAGAAAEVAVASINTAAAIYIADKQLDIAQQAQDIANKLNEHMCENYYPCEIKLLNEVCNAPIPEIEYDEQAGRFATTARLQYAKVKEELSKRFSRFCCGNHMRLMKDLAIAEAQGVTDSINYSYRVAEQRKQALEDLRHNKIFQTLGMGRGLASQAISYSQTAGSILNSLGTQASSAASSAFEAIGYRQRANAATQGLSYTPQSNQFTPTQYNYLSNYSAPSFVSPVSNAPNYNINPQDPFAVGASSNSYNYYGVGSAYDSGYSLLGDAFGLGGTP